MSTELEVKDKIKLDKPRNYKVILLNDNYTSMDFVTEVLQSIFHYSWDDASAIMLLVHSSGAGVAGVYTREIAETRVWQAKEFAKERGHPLEVLMEAE
jgi:ATP-dependent Clp protease adaptor protein ClpS